MPISETHLCDCMDFMRRIEDKRFDITITSPPYNLGDKHHTGNKIFFPYSDNMPELKYQEWQLNILNEIFRITKDDGCLLYNHKNRIKEGKQITPYEWILKSKWIVKQELVWFNGSQNFDKCRFYPMTERIFFLSKTTETNFTNNINHHDLFEWNAEGSNNFHKRAFPIRMVKDMLACFPIGKVFDPFLGSGSSRIAAYDMGFDFWATEIDKDYFEAQEKRFNLFKSQLKLF